MTAGQIRNNGTRNQDLVRSVNSADGLDFGIRSAPVLTENNPQKMLRFTRGVTLSNEGHVIPTRASILLESSSTMNRILIQANSNQQHFIVAPGGSLTIGNGITLSGGIPG